MENHPIPQDVTGFQFKLIGNMTVKQFAYLAIGVVLGWVLLQLPVSILIKFPFSAFSAIFGIGLAYFPISGRPMDVMIGNYIKALLRPTQFVYEKTGGQIYFPNKTPMAIMETAIQHKNDFNPFPKDQLKAYLESANIQPKNKVDEKENNFLMSVSGLATTNTPYQPDISPNLNIQQVNPQPPISPDVQGTTIPKQNVESPLSIPNIPKSPNPEEQAKPFKPVLSGFNKTAGTLSAPDSPNLIIGITKDSRGNALPNILVEVKDKDGNPVRAFKTNEVGRFASATPLIGGTYTITFEDPKGQNRFEKVAINATGQIIMPIEAISIDTREELRRSLFTSSS